MPSNPRADHSISAFEHAQALLQNTRENASQKGLSKPGLWAIIRSAGATRVLTAAMSIFWPATMSSVIPVSFVISRGIGLPGCCRPP